MLIFEDNAFQFHCISGFSLISSYDSLKLLENTSQFQGKSLYSLMFPEDLGSRVFPFDEKAAIAFAEIATKIRRMGKQIS